MPDIDLKTQKILDYFRSISAIPRKSKHEEKILAFMIEWANKNSFDYKQDTTGNIVVHIPASTGYESAPPVIIQSHVDMVCVKTNDSNHDFSTDSIKNIIEGDWMRADNTTLGADNGIAVAMSMAVATDPEVQHPALELLFTVDEETGLTGAASLEEGFLQGTKLINLDTEDDGVFIIGCAGGKDTHTYFPVEWQELAPEELFYTLKVENLTGGHSGCDIHLNRGNAIKVLAEVLEKIQQDFSVQLADITGGMAHNAIPGNAQAIIASNAEMKTLEQAITQLEKHWQETMQKTDAQLTITVEAADNQSKVLTPAATTTVINAIKAIPHGVYKMSADIPDLVETSNNLATVALTEKELVINTSQRSSANDGIDIITQKIIDVAQNMHGRYESDNGYPGWEPNINSPLLAQTKAVYKKLFGKDPEVEAIHAGLECGIIGQKFPDLDMISFGPTIKDPHSPSERVFIPAIANTWQILVHLLAEMK